ncbi:DUF2628 domain-containing protein [Pseudomonas sp.]|uniref:DUF2628 domain-containing protein n=1 Tax=Pseudomonas sp. TaxID=306 RepID=UPI0028B1971B|nr:DUF2628 domain-containing protein [Pseudomonas sp.]
MADTQHTLSPDTSLNEKWQERFAFFERYGGPQSPHYQAAFKALPGKKRRLIAMNVIAFFFGLIYLFVLGMWRKNLSLIGIGLAIGLVLGLIEVAFDLTLPRGVDFGINGGIAAMYGMSTNYGYYLTRVKGSKSWNPFEGMRWF